MALAIAVTALEAGFDTGWNGHVTRVLRRVGGMIELAAWDRTLRATR
jgi:hypothetical protein